jgi:ethanolamine utilization protein EutQ (cupin superfamily)
LTWSIFHKLRSDPGYRQWADVASQLFGGLDILTVDAIIEAETGKVWLVPKTDTNTFGIRAWSRFPLEFFFFCFRR